MKTSSHSRRVVKGRKLAGLSNAGLSNAFCTDRALSKAALSKSKAGPCTVKGRTKGRTVKCLLYRPCTLSILLRPYGARGCRVASLAEGTAVALMQRPLLVRAGILQFVHGAGDSLPALREGHHGVFNAHQLLPADGTPV